MALRLLSLVTKTPKHSMSQDLAARWVAQLSNATAEQTEFQIELFRRTGVRRRSSVLLERDQEGSLTQTLYKPGQPPPSTEVRMQRYSVEAVRMAVQSSAPVIEQSGYQPRDITHVITVSCTGCIAPGLDQAVTSALGLSPNVHCTNIGFMGCAGAFNALAAAKPIIEAQPDARVLICAVELCTLHFRFEHEMQQIIANSLFADGAAALIADSPAAERPASAGWILDAMGAYTIPNSQNDLGWRICDHGFKMTLSAELPNLICSNLRNWLEPWLGQHKLRIRDVPTWAIHPGGPKILEAAAESLGIPMESVAASADVLAEHGNMSSPTILFILQKLRLANAPRPCVAVGFGPGVVAHAALFR